MTILFAAFLAYGTKVGYTILLSILVACLTTWALGAIFVKSEASFTPNAMCQTFVLCTKDKVRNCAKIIYT